MGHRRQVAAGELIDAEPLTESHSDVIPSSDWGLEALLERDPGAFRFGAANLTWRDHVLDSRTIQTDRAEGLHGFGSCSFTEPIEDLVAMGIGGVAG